MKVYEHLNWDDQINSVCRNLSNIMSVLYRVKHILNNDCLKSLYCTLILLYLNYACEIWGNTFETRLKNLVVLQKRAIRLVDKANYREHSEPLFAKYKCLKLCDIVNLKTLIITFQAEYNMLPVNLQKMLKKSMYVHKYNTRSCTKGNFEVKFCRWE